LEFALEKKPLNPEVFVLQKFKKGKICLINESLARTTRAIDMIIKEIENIIKEG